MRIRLVMPTIALLPILSICGCKKSAEVVFELQPDLAPVVALHSKGVIVWRPTPEQHGVIVAIRPNGLCKEGDDLRAEDERPAVCTIKPEAFQGDGKQTAYSVEILKMGESFDPDKHPTYRILVPCRGCSN